MGNLAGCSHAIIRKWMKKHSIPRRKSYEWHVNKTASMKYKNRFWLINEYVNKKKSEREIATELRIDQKTIHRWLVIHNIKRRKPHVPKGKLRSLESIAKKLGVEYGWVWMIKNGYSHRVPTEIKEKLIRNGARL